MKLKNETLNNSNRYLTGDELDILLGNVHDPCKYRYFPDFGIMEIIRFLLRRIRKNLANKDSF